MSSIRDENICHPFYYSEFLFIMQLKLSDISQYLMRGIVILLDYLDYYTIEGNALKQEQ